MQIDNQLKQQIEDEATSLSSANKVFTAYNITQILRDKGVTVLHEAVREVISSMYYSGKLPTNYVRTLKTIAPSSIPTWVYHNNSVDIISFDGRVTTPRTPISTSQGSPSAVRKAVDFLGRIRIPKPNLQQAGINPGDTVVVWPSGNNTLLICNNPRFLGRRYKVDSKGNVRISLSNFSGIRRSSHYNVANDTTPISREGIVKAIME